MSINPLGRKEISLAADLLLGTGWNQGNYRFKRFYTGSFWSDIYCVTKDQMICSTDSSIQVWDVESERVVARLQDLEGFDLEKIFLDDADLHIHYATCGAGGSFAVWNKRLGHYLWGEKSCCGKLLQDETKLLAVLPRNRWCPEKKCVLNVPDRIQLWNKLDGTPLLSIDEDIDVWTLHMDDHRIIAATEQRSVKIWSKESGEVIRELRFSEKVEKLFIEENEFIIQLANGNVQIFDLSDFSLASNFEFSQVEALKSSRGYSQLVFDSDVILSKSNDVVVGWSRKTNQPLFQIDKCSHMHSLDAEKMLYFVDGVMEVRNKYTGRILFRLDHDRKISFTAQCDEHRIFALTDAKDLKIWDKETGEPLFVVHGVHDFKIEKDLLCISYVSGYTDICDFSSDSQFPRNGKLEEVTS